MNPLTPLDFYAGPIFYQLDELADDAELIETVKACLEVQRSAGAGALKAKFRPDPLALHKVSEEALKAILETGQDISDVRTHQDLSNCLVFNTATLDHSVPSEQVVKIRKKVDRVIADRIKRLFRHGEQLSVVNSGHFWYPPGGYMGWHTNMRNPGWRLYISYVEEPGKSFFRYRDPDRSTVITEKDREWNFRLFRIETEKPLWHAVYSETNRFSIGYKIIVAPALTLRQRVKRKLKGALSRVGVAQEILGRGRSG